MGRVALPAATVFILCSALMAQRTQVSATVQDINGSVYVNCNGSASFIGQNTTPGAGPYLLGGSVFQTSTAIHCDGSGNFSATLADNNQVSPTPSQWAFSLCSASGYIGGPYCKTVLVTITGATQNITSSLTTQMPLLPLTSGTINLNGVGIATQYPGADIGAKVNAVVSALGCSEIYIPAGSYSYTTSIVIPRCVHLHGASGYASALTYTPTSGCAIIIADGQGTSIYPPGGVEDLNLIGAGSGNNTCGVFFGGTDGTATAPSSLIDPATNYGDHAVANRVRITGFGEGVQYGMNTWLNTLFEVVSTSNGDGAYLSATVAGGNPTSNSGENMNILNSALQNNAHVGLRIGTGIQVNFNLVNTSLDFNGQWCIQNGTSASQTAVHTLSGYCTSSSGQWIQNYGYMTITGAYMNGGASVPNNSYLIDNENATNFTVLGGQFFNGQLSGTTPILNPSGQCSTWLGTLVTGTGSTLTPVCTFIDRFGNANFLTSITSPGGLNIGVVTVTGGTGATVYRCATAGATLPAGSLTTVAGACGTTVDSGLRIK